MERMTIGEFAREAGLTPKALRLYDEMGLIVPADVDPVSGYRCIWVGGMSAFAFGCARPFYPSTRGALSCVREST